MLQRNCPNCKKIIKYKTVSAFNHASKHKKVCYGCRKPKPRLSSAEKALRKEEQKQYHKNYRKQHKEYISDLKKNSLIQSKIEGIAHYGGKCSCPNCPESNSAFLTIEHKNGRVGDSKAFKSNKNPNGLRCKRTGKQMWQTARAEGWPDKYTVLCFNCNCAKSVYGICPHIQEPKLEATKPLVSPRFSKLSVWR